MNSPADPRLILSESELDLGLELVLLAQTGIWTAVDAALEGEAKGLGRGHWRVAFLVRRRPGVGVKELARLTGLTKQAASKTLADLEALGLVEKTPGELDTRRRPASLTAEGLAFEARVGERLRGLVAMAYRDGGLDGVGAARRILASLAGPRLTVRREEP
ncbi:MarR family transcriptional regulator [Caulobacter sp. SLTY]|uniref:MarR family winged helix-turn-helix transcriptional regulator n=1 Tax=Caulobacter sp. SLTY TaxID=2683262 RepID=UPI001412D259|nr:helix-turn-helix domain-containing protein [Caulobacter sp. SLTY]NBB14016.1 MarR family transcriptional regulator [Caulobacter sp. SLTY]